MKYLLCFFTGGLYTLSFSPYNIQALSFVSIILLFLILDLQSTKDSIIKSLLFAIGYFSVGTYWLENVINYYTDINFYIAVLLVFIFTIYLSLFIVIPVLISSLFIQHLKFNKNFALILLSILITCFEIIRSFLFTGYSWFNFGQSAIGTPLDSFFPVIGVHGNTFIMFIISLILINIVKGINIKFFTSILIFFVIINLNINNKNWTIASNENIAIAIVQPNINNKLHYTTSEIVERMSILESMIFKSLLSTPDIILLPEAPLSIPSNEILNYYFKILENIPSNTSILTGSFNRHNEKIYNSIINISDFKFLTSIRNYKKDFDAGLSKEYLANEQENIIINSNSYNKKHLVPFGEYLPLRNILSGFYKFLSLNTYDLSAGNSNNSIKVNKFIAHALICYESIFSDNALVKNPNVDFIVNVSNDGWFGNSLAPYQHLDSLVMRSLENQRFSIRSANTGISAVINPFGEIVDYLAYEEMGVINSKINSRTGLTPLAKHGYKILYLLMFTIFIYSSIYFNIRIFRR